jgi:ubiquinone biosynthesis protein COQ4
MSRLRLTKGIDDIVKNFTPLTSNKDRLAKMLNYAVLGLKDPENGEHISRLTDLSSMRSLRWIKIKMEETEEGRLILKEQPRITEETSNFKNLKEYPHNTLGYAYYKYMNENNFTPDERPIAKYLPDLELAYICQRYKETHDFYHILLGYGRTIPEELAVKWFESLHLRLPSSAIASLWGGLIISFSANLNLISNYLPHVISNSEKSKFLLGIYFEKRLEQDINKLREELNIIPLDKFL